MKPRLPLGVGIWPVIGIQAACSFFFVWDIAASLFGVAREPIPWQLREIAEIAAALGLLGGVAVGAVYLRGVVRRNRAMERQIRDAATAFGQLLDERFDEWGLTPSERDVAWFTIKGLPIGEIARLRNTSEGTVKAQSNAIYRKSGVSGRAQLLSLFLEDLMEPRPPAPTAPPRAASGGT